MAYSDKVLDHYENPRNVGKMDMDDKRVGTGMVGAPACGDVMKLQIKIEDGLITDAKFKTYGCGSAIASSSLLTEWVKGMTIEEAGSHTEYGNSRRIGITTSEDTLFGASRRRNQISNRRLQKEKLNVNNN